jgi:hypothetical protein
MGSSRRDGYPKSNHSQKSLLSVGASRCQALFLFSGLTHLYYHLSQYIPITLVGLCYLSRLGPRLGDITREAVYEADHGPTKVQSSIL